MDSQARPQPAAPLVEGSDEVQSAAGSSDREFVVGTVTVRPIVNEIERDGSTIKVEHRVMQLLVYLSANSGRDLTKENILLHVWGEGVHNDEVLTVAVSSLRKALGDDARNPRYVKTLPRRGYRFIEQSTEFAAKSSFFKSVAERVGPRFLVIAILAGALLLVIALQILVELVYMIGRL